MNKYFRNLRHIFRHKWYVLLECFGWGLYRQGIVHDLSKFSLTEFRAYADNFFGNKERGDFDYAWLHHQHKNKHHWNYWVIDQNKKVAVKMPFKYMLEMICDWKAMSRDFGNDVSNWYREHADRMILHPETRQDIENFLNLDWNEFLDKKQL